LRHLKPVYWHLYWRLRSWREGRSDPQAAFEFLFRRDLGIPFAGRLELLRRFAAVSRHVTPLHTQQEMLEVATAILTFPRHLPGVVVEAGCSKGGSTAKLSLCAALAGRRLVVFDSFEGIPDNDEVQVDLTSARTVFTKGQYAGSLGEVRRNVGAYGNLSICDFVKGWFCDTMVGFDQPVCVTYLDVDLVSSTKDCLRRLYPRVVAGGTLFSQDGHLSSVGALFADERFWEGELGVPQPVVRGLGQRKLISIAKRG
jgi:O-methyltransferase